MKVHERTQAPSMSQEEGPGRPYLEVYHIHYGPGYQVKAVLKGDVRGGWRTIKVWPLPEHMGTYDTAHEALQAIGVDPREVLGPGALSRAGLAGQEQH